MKKIIIFVLLNLFFPSLVFSKTISLISQKTVLDNGLTVLITEMPSSSMVSVYALVKTGSATEGKYLGAGISHFLEHMLFKGTTKRKVGEIAAQVQAVGGSINASTGYDYTIYTLIVPAQAFDTALDVLSDMLMNSTMDPEEVESERKVVFGEMRLRDDDPDRWLNELVTRNVYLRHPYRHPIIGYRPLFAAITRDDIVDYYQSHYAPNNIIFSVAGRVASDSVLPKIKETFKTFKRQNDIPRDLPAEPLQLSARRYEDEYPTNLTRLSLSFQGVSLLHKDLYALDVLAKILGDGESSRLYLDVYRNKNLVHSITSYNYTPSDMGVFSVEALLDEKNVEPAIKSIKADLNEIKKKGARPEEIEKAKRQVLSEHIINQQTTGDVAYARAVDEASTGDYNFSAHYVEAVRSVKNEDIVRVANQYLKETASTTVVLWPKKEVAPVGKKSEAAAVTPIEKFTLPNGLTVLVRENYSFPTISMRLVVNGGTRQESVELNGLSKMMSDLWLKGTRSYNAVDIAIMSERLGINLSSYSGKNSFGLNMEFLSSDWTTSLKLLEELVKYPLFPDKEIEKVRENLKAGILARDDDIFKVTSHALKEMLFLTHPLRMEEEGTLETIARIKTQDVLQYYQNLMIPGNVVISVFGDIDAKKVLADIKNNFASLSSKKAIIKEFGEAPPNETRERELSMKKEQAMVMIGFQGPDLSGKDNYGVDVMTSILGSSFNGRLFNKIREELGQAYTLGGDFIPGPDMGFIYFYVLTTDENIQKVKDVLFEEIKKIREEQVSERELNAMKVYMKGNFKASQETNSSLSFMTSLDELYGLGFTHYQQFDEKIDMVTPEEIKSLADRYLNLNQAAVVVTRPDKSDPIKR